MFTLRSATNQPHVTISLNIHADGRLSIDQIKGKQNRHPIRRYADDVLTFLRVMHLPAERHMDCEDMGIVYEPSLQGEASTSGWKFITEVQDPDFLLNAMQSNFHLIEHFDRPPVVLQWLMLRLAPHQLEQVRHLDPAVAAAARLLLPPADWPPILQAASPAPASGAQSWQIEGLPIDPLLCAPIAERH